MVSKDEGWKDEGAAEKVLAPSWLRDSGHEYPAELSFRHGSVEDIDARPAPLSGALMVGMNHSYLPMRTKGAQ